MAAPTAAAAAAAPFPTASRFEFKGHSCSFVEAGQGPPILLLHGFAGSAYNCWRSTVPALAASGHTVFGLDLLGLGASDQPMDVEYSIDLWRQQASAFVKERMGDEPPIIIGHSFGSLIALELAAELAASGTPVRAVGMMNCGVGMNNNNALKVEEWRTGSRGATDADAGAIEPTPEWQLSLFGFVFGTLINTIFNQKWLLSLILERFATAENVRGALAGSVYVNGEARVDDALVDDYLSLAADREAAVEVLRQIYTNDGGPLPFDAAASLPDELPILTVWGENDNLAPATGPVGCYFRARAKRLDATRFEALPECGHVPQDDRPERTNAILKEWLATV